MVEADSADRLTVKFDKYKWILNTSACQLVNVADLGHIQVGTDSDSDQRSSGMSLCHHYSLSLSFSFFFLFSPPPVAGPGHWRF